MVMGSSVLNILGLRCLLDIKIRYAKKTVGYMNMKSGNRCEPDVKI